MKKILTFILVCFSLSLVSQEVKNDSVVSDSVFIDRYCTVIGIGRMMTFKVNISVDFGQVRHFFGEIRLKDEITEKVIKFDSMIDAVNYMSDNGWALVSTNVISKGNWNDYYFVMKKTIKYLPEKK